MTVKSMVITRRNSISQVDVGQDYILHWTPVPKYGSIGAQNFVLALTGTANVPFYQRQMLRFMVYWIPLYDERQLDDMHTTRTQLTTLVNQEVPKVFSVAGPALATSWNPFGPRDDDDDSTPATPGSDHKDPQPYHQGDTAADTPINPVDTMIWRPDRIPLMAISDAWSPAMLYEKTMMLGMHYGAATKVADNECVYFHTERGTFGRGIRSAPVNGYIVYILELPPQVSSTEFTRAHQNPAGNDWRDLQDLYSPELDFDGQPVNPATDAGTLSYQWARHHNLWIREKGDDTTDNLDLDATTTPTASLESKVGFRVAFDIQFNVIRTPHSPSFRTYPGPL